MMIKYRLITIKKISFSFVFACILLAFPCGAPYGADSPNQCQNPTSEYWQDASTPITANLSIDHLPIVGEPVTITCEVTSVLDAPHTTAKIELPHDTHVLNGTLIWEGNLSAGDVTSFSATILFDSSGNKDIFCRALRVIDEENAWGDLSSLYLSIGDTETAESFSPIPPEERDILGVPDSPGEGQIINDSHAFPSPSFTSNALIFQSKNNNPPSTTPSNISKDSFPENPSSPGSLTITGRWRFYDRDDNQVSEQMLVEIVRGDTSVHLAWCYTDTDGYYSCGPFSNPGSAGVRSRFLSYASFSPYSDVLVTINPDWGTTPDTANAFATSTSVQTFSDGTQSIGSWTIPNGNSYERAYWITSDLIKAWKYVWFGTGSSQSPQETTGSATVEWKIDSTDGTYCVLGGNIHLKGADPLSDTVVNHEYGHSIMYSVYGDYFPDSHCPSPHYIQLSSHVNCAWTEGWANFFTIAVNNDPVYRWASGASLNLETPTWGTSGWDEGEDVEGRVAGALWDIIDSVNDGYDQYSEGTIINIWDTLYHQNDDNFSEYWSAWQSRGHNILGAIMSIYQNTIDYLTYYTLTVNKTGNGTVTSFPSGINCGSTCSSIYASGTSVTLTATPDTGWAFSSWSGACAGPGSCQVNMDSDKNVTAEFVVSCLPPEKPSNTSPANGVTTSFTVPRLLWQSVPGADSYDVEVCSDSNCSTIIRSVNVTENSWIVFPALEHATPYYWHARAHNACGPGSWSDTWTFTTPSGPDLVLNTFTFPSPATKGTFVTLTATVGNKGTSTVNSFSVGFYTSPTNRIASCNIYTLGAGSFKSCSASIFIPSGLPSGTYPLGALADYNNYVHETNEWNNLKIEMITIQ